MTRAYIVTDNAMTLEILQRLLPEHIITVTQLLDGQGSYGALSMARTLLVTRQLPVALVSNADKNEQRAMRQQRDELRSLLFDTAAGEPFEAFVVASSAEALLVQERAVVEQLLQRPLTDSEWDAAQANPRAVVDNLPGGAQSLGAALDNLPAGAKQVLQQHPLITDLSTFLTAALSETEQVMERKV